MVAGDGAGALAPEWLTEAVCGEAVEAAEPGGITTFGEGMPGGITSFGAGVPVPGGMTTFGATAAALRGTAREEDFEAPPVGFKTPPPAAIAAAAANRGDAETGAAKEYV